MCKDITANTVITTKQTNFTERLENLRKQLHSKWQQTINMWRDSLGHVFALQRVKSKLYYVVLNVKKESLVLLLTFDIAAFRYLKLFAQFEWWKQNGSKWLESSGEGKIVWSG